MRRRIEVTTQGKAVYVIDGAKTDEEAIKLATERAAAGSPLDLVAEAIVEVVDAKVVADD